MNITYRNKLLTSSLLVSASMLATPAFAQTEPTATPQAPAKPATEPVVAAPNQGTGAATNETNEIVVTGSRIVRPNLTSNSPVAVVTGEETTQHGDITLETFLNTLPQVNPSTTSTSNNPGAGGAAYIDLRGLGPNRNLVLINGRRPMVSSASQIVDVNTIPQGLIERIDVVTGAAGATYGADAIAGVVNIILKDHFEGVDLRANYSNSIPETDAREWQISGTIGGNFADDRGNFALSAEVAKRQPLFKSQRSFASQATSTTGTPPTGRLVGAAGNTIPASAIAALFGTYGVTDPNGQPVSNSKIGFNSDGSLFNIGVFNSPNNVSNFKYSLDSAANPNLNFYPDFYSYNFDIINLLTLPLNRKSVFTKGNYEISPAVDVFVQANYTEYQAQQALAPTPIGTHIRNPASQSSPTQAVSPFVNQTCPTTANPNAPCDITGLVVPVTNPFIPADLATLLAARTGDNPILAGTGANEAINISYRFLPAGLRIAVNKNKVYQGLLGVRGDIAPGWRYEAYASYGKTDIVTNNLNNVDVQKVQTLLEAPDGGASICAGGFNPFGIQPFSQECTDYVKVTGTTGTTFTQKIYQAFVSGELAQLPAGPLAVVLGAERRDFRYVFDPGALSGAIAGFNTATPSEGTNRFTDFFGEVNVPIAKDSPWAESAELNLQARHSTSQFNDILQDIHGKPEGSWAYGVNASWAPIHELRLRAAYNHSVRAPNFGELFSGGANFPTIYDPCSSSTAFRAANGTAGRALCVAQNVPNPDQFAQTPGIQAILTGVGNRDLKPEEGNTITVGAVFQKWGFTGSVDYYNIEIKKAIFFPDPNLLIADCFNYFGHNPSLDPNFGSCAGIVRSGGDIAAVILPKSISGDNSTYYFHVANVGHIRTDGLDIQMGYRAPMDFIQGGAHLDFNLLVNYLHHFKQQELPGVVLDYAGTASYSGEGISATFPRWKGQLQASLNVKPFTFETRFRYIDHMKNRASLQFPGETFTGPKSIVYTDVAVQADIRNITLRLGVNNLFDKSPPLYAPNVQSGTDPSTYDVIGRRAYVEGRVRF